MDLRLRDKTALVTGASTGIGRAIARGLAAEGARVAAWARRAELLESLLAEIEAEGGPAPALILQDILAEDAAPRLREAALGALGDIDILVNCAGGSRPLPLDAPEAIWEEALTLNFTRHRQVTHALLPGIIARRWGRIINITGKSEREGLNAAFADKAAMHAWPRACRARWAGTASP